MISKLTLRNFKSVGEQVYDFTTFDLLVGRNNSGKSTVLQALAIWQFCVDEFHHVKRRGATGIQVVLPNFTALPLPEFNLLWKDRTDRTYKNNKQEFILIEVDLEWRGQNGELESFGIELRYQSSQAIYAKPKEGWSKFRECEKRGDFPRIAYVPPFSGLEPTEKRMDDPPIRQQVGKGQPGSVLRNLMLKVCPPQERGDDGKVPKGLKSTEDWLELEGVARRWFDVELSTPKYDSLKDIFITMNYRQSGTDFDIISGGSGFHQTLTLLAFLYGYKPTTILLDEPDAHLHVNLQREILDYFKLKSAERNIQFLVATHAEEFISGVDVSQIISLLDKQPTRVSSKPEVLAAMAEVSNEEITKLLASPYMLYVEGESDARILRGWANSCEAESAIDKVCFKVMGGGGKENMKKAADNHFKAIQQIIPDTKRLMLFDYDTNEEAFHPLPDNESLAEWKRKNIENYLLVPSAWKRSVKAQLQWDEDDLFFKPYVDLIDDFFAGQNLTLPPNQNWRQVGADIFSVVNGKKILFENNDSLFQKLKARDDSVIVIRESIAMSMTADEIHQDVHTFFDKLKQITDN